MAPPTLSPAARAASARRASFFDGLAKQLGPGHDKAVAIFASAPVAIRNHDVEHEYRQDSDVFYLTGFDEPESVLVLTYPERRATAFVRRRDPERETWDGPRAGVEGMVPGFGVDEAFVVDSFDDELPKLLADRTTLVYRLGRDRAMDDRILRGVDRARARGRTGLAFPTTFVDPSTVVHEQRLFKGEADLSAMREACRITGDAHARLMAETRPGMHEFELEARLLDTFRRAGSERAAYGSIVGSGPNATILHYRKNDRRIEDGDLVLVDAGCEYGYFASDVTRTFPANGAFTKPQQAIYELVLESQLAALDATKPGATLDQIHDLVVRVLVSGLVRLGLLSGEPEKLIEEGAHRAYYMHRTSHWLGMDVHDVGRYFEGGRPRPLAAGMVLTIEPGIYVGVADERAPAEYRGIGVRIEDDVLVSADGHVNLTASIPKTVAEVRAASGR